jgi:Cof subfamily protein (haloacid dehalogenase superfamily)
VLNLKTLYLPVLLVLKEKVLYRLLALDLDGTLVDEGKPLPPHVIEALQEVAKKGVTIAIVTGRMHRAALPYAKALNLSMPLISYQGAMVRHTVTDEIIYHQPLPFALAREFIVEMQQRKHHINLYLNDNLYVAESTLEVKAYEFIAGVTAEVVGDLLEFIDQKQEPPTKVLAITDAKIAPELYEEMHARFNPQLYITRSYATFTEALNPLCSKGKALAALAKSMGISSAETIAVGDNLNDLPMLEWAGLGVAVANADKALKPHAGYITTKRVSEGVLEVIEKFL